MVVWACLCVGGASENFLLKTRYINSLFDLIWFDVLQKTVPDPYSSDWICSVAVGRLRGVYEQQTVRQTKWNADAFETQTLLGDEVRQRGMTVSGHEVCIICCVTSASWLWDLIGPPTSWLCPLCAVTDMWDAVWTNPHTLLLLLDKPTALWEQLNKNHCGHGSSKPVCQIVGCPLGNSQPLR